MALIAALIAVPLITGLIGAGITYVQMKQNNELAQQMMQQMQQRDQMAAQMISQTQGQMYPPGTAYPQVGAPSGQPGQAAPGQAGPAGAPQQNPMMAQFEQFEAGVQARNSALFQQAMGTMQQTYGMNGMY